MRPHQLPLLGSLLMRPPKLHGRWRSPRARGASRAYLRWAPGVGHYRCCRLSEAPEVPHLVTPNRSVAWPTFRRAWAGSLTGNAVHRAALRAVPSFSWSLRLLCLAERAAFVVGISGPAAYIAFHSRCQSPPPCAPLCTTAASQCSSNDALRLHHRTPLGTSP